MADPNQFFVGNAPAGASYQTPRLDFSALANAPQTIFNAQQNRRTQQLQNAFPNGLPRKPNGEVDVQAAGDTLTKLGGAEFAAPLIAQFQDMQIGANAGRDVTGGNPAPSNFPASGPANIRGPQQPNLSSAGADNAGQDTIRSVATETFGGRDVSQLIPRYAAALKVNPDAPLPPEKVALARTLMAQTAQSLRAQAANDSGGGVRPTPASGVSGAPGPAPSNAPEAPQGLPNSVGAIGIPLSQYPSKMQEMQQNETYLRGQAAQYAARKPEIANQLEKQAASLQAFRKSMFDELQQFIAPTGPMKDVAADVAGRQETQKANATAAAGLFKGIAGAAQEARRNLAEFLPLAKSILNNPDFYSGTGANRVLDYNKIKASFGGDPRRAMLMEGLQKINANSVLSQINQQRDELLAETGGSSGRIFAQQVDQINKASPSLEGSPAGNRFLIEVQRRGAELAKEMERQALDYRASHNDALDRGFYVKIGKYLDTHPLYTEDELADPAKIGAVDLPRGLQSKQQVGAWVHAMQLRPGEAIRTPDGKYKAAP